MSFHTVWGFCRRRGSGVCCFFLKKTQFHCIVLRDRNAGRIQNYVQHIRNNYYTMIKEAYGDPYLRHCWVTHITLIHRGLRDSLQTTSSALQNMEHQEGPCLQLYLLLRNGEICAQQESYQVLLEPLFFPVATVLIYCLQFQYLTYTYAGLYCLYFINVGKSGFSFQAGMLKRSMP